MFRHYTLDGLRQQPLLPNAVHVSCVDSSVNLPLLVNAAGMIEHLDVPSPRGAVVGDYFLRYYKGGCNGGAFVAAGVVIKDAWQEAPRRYRARLDGLQMLPKPVMRREMLALVPGWGYPKMPGWKATVPEHLAAAVLLACALEPWLP